MTIRRWFRRVWRAAFCREPIYLDGPYIKMRMLFGGLSWEQALAERGQMNERRALAWHRGEP